MMEADTKQSDRVSLRTTKLKWVWWKIGAGSKRTRRHIVKGSSTICGRHIPRVMFCCEREMSLNEASLHGNLCTTCFRILWRRT